ncbi:hypothetical protein NG798_11925 [Ancylothrix sp. C2]|uniref:NfeD family protein n=1 Tax=Ancylothrix sp. D3o TaxID=2953691 RepID=UPI0021BAB440|nr:hypothetical protein [Ancylothrix sp. D3o]MCT7950499.1 hypothetical protein [Ancylothrix sp. D3o]
MPHLLDSAKIKLFSETIPAIVEQEIAPGKRGRVKCIGKYWPASLYPPSCHIIFSPGEPVLVVGMEKMTLLIRPFASTP